VIFGRAGKDSLFGGDGDDQLFGNNGGDLLAGGLGTDDRVKHSILEASRRTKVND
jgi:Ca2+-binding RTX toxin-like protein